MKFRARGKVINNEAFITAAIPIKNLPAEGGEGGASFSAYVDKVFRLMLN